MLKRLIWRMWEETAVSSRTFQQLDAEFSVLGFLPPSVTVVIVPSPPTRSRTLTLITVTVLQHPISSRSSELPLALLPCTMKFKQTAGGPALTAPLSLLPAPFNTGYFKQRRSAEVNNAQTWLTFPQEINKYKKRRGYV